MNQAFSQMQCFRCYFYSSFFWYHIFPPERSVGANSFRFVINIAKILGVYKKSWIYCNARTNDRNLARFLDNGLGKWRRGYCYVNKIRRKRFVI